MIEQLQEENVDSSVENVQEETKTEEVEEVKAKTEMEQTAGDEQGEEKKRSWYYKMGLISVGISSGILLIALIVVLANIRTLIMPIAGLSVVGYFVPSVALKRFIPEFNRDIYKKKLALGLLAGAFLLAVVAMVILMLASFN